jgi:hypothetical protein
MNLKRTLAAVTVATGLTACGGGGSDSGPDFGGATISPVTNGFGDVVAFEIKTSENVGGQTAYCSHDGAYAVIKRVLGTPGLSVAFGCVARSGSLPIGARVLSTGVADFTMLGYGAAQQGVSEVIVGYDGRVVESVSTLSSIPFDGRYFCLTPQGFQPDC